MGYLYKQKSRDGTPGRIWWAKYYVNGRPVRESTDTEKETEARRFLKAREGRVAIGQPILPRADRVRYDEVAQDLRQHYRATGTRGLAEAEFRLAHLDRHFRGWRIAGIDVVEINAYVVKRQREGAANGTINRELGVLNRMFRLAYESGNCCGSRSCTSPKRTAHARGFSSGSSTTLCVVAFGPTSRWP